MTEQAVLDKLWDRRHECSEGKCALRSRGSGKPSGVGHSRFSAWGSLRFAFRVTRRSNRFIVTLGRVIFVPLFVLPSSVSCSIRNGFVIHLHPLGTLFREEAGCDLVLSVQWMSGERLDTIIPRDQFACNSPGTVGRPTEGNGTS